MNNFYMDGYTQAGLWVVVVLGGAMLLAIFGKLLFRMYFEEKKKYLSDLTQIQGEYEDGTETDEAK